MMRTTIQISNPRDLPQLMAPLAFLLACDKVPQAGFEPDTGLTLELIVLKKRKGASPTWWRSCNRWGSWPRRWSPREGGSHSSGRENWLAGRKTWKGKKVGRKSDWEPSALDPVLDHEELANDEDDPEQVDDGSIITTSWPPWHVTDGEHPHDAGQHEGKVRLVAAFLPRPDVGVPVNQDQEVFKLN